MPNLLIRIYIYSRHFYNLVRDEWPLCTTIVSEQMSTIIRPNNFTIASKTAQHNCNLRIIEIFKIKGFYYTLLVISILSNASFTRRVRKHDYHVIRRAINQWMWLFLFRVLVGHHSIRKEQLIE